VTVRLVVASLNIHGVPFSRVPATVRAARIGDVASRLDPDVLCVQEVHTYPVLRALAASVPSLPYPGHVPGAARPSGGLVTFTREPAGRVTFAPLPGPGGQPDRLRRLLNAERRKALLVTELAGGAGTVINLHLSPNRDGDWSPGNRYEAVHRAQLAAVAGQAAGEGARHDGPLIVTGDFNVAKDSELFTGFARQSGLADAFAGQLPATFRGRPGRPGRCIDHLLYRPGRDGLSAVAAGLAFAEPESFAGGQRGFLSDHQGLLVTLGNSPSSRGP
jgi:endonuclease/exonuclease/phosphatase family metal-dependent hydrolase